MTRILIVEDEAAYREPLEYALKRDGFSVTAVGDGETALTAATMRPPDVVLLDVMLPGLSGIEVATRLRAQQETANATIIMVTAKDHVVDRVVGLEVGADDYVSKPYSYRELLARIHAIIRRLSRTPTSPEQSEETENVLTVGPLHMDIDRHIVMREDEEITMPLREFELLEYFMRHPGRVLTREQIFDRVWGPHYEGDTKTLDVHIKRLRAKLENDPHHPQLIVTIRGLGYRLENSGNSHSSLPHRRP